VRPRRVTGGFHLSAAVSLRARSLPLSLCPVGPLCRHQLPSPARPFPSLPRGPALSACRVVPRTPAPSRCVVGPLGQLLLPRDPPWTSAHACRDPHPRRLPTCPSSLLSSARTRTRSPVPHRTSSPSLSLCPRYSTSPETRARRANHPARQKPHQATTSFASSETSFPMLGFSQFSIVVGQFGFAGVRRRRFVAPTR
jgi:hypothetical protein